MSIDRIGKGAGISGPANPTATEGSRPKGTFSVGSSESTENVKTVGPAEQVRSGQLDVSGYVDQRVEAATQHLHGKLGAADLAEVQSMLKSQLANDPALREMVQAATGVLPPSEGE